MASELQGKVALITGGTSGIGRETALLFAKEGAKVVISGRRGREGKEVVDLIFAGGGDALFVKADVSHSADVQSLVQKTVDKYGRLDVRATKRELKGTGCRLSNSPKKTGTPSSPQISKAFGCPSNTKSSRCLRREMAARSSTCLRSLRRVR
jgi:NADPH:quinone reductase-like Zn-dependent oxidoreductase